MCHFVQDDPHPLKYVIQDIMTTSSSLPKRCTIDPLAAQLNSMVSSWTANGKATTAGPSLVFEDNVGEDGLSSQSTYKVNIDCPYYKEAIAPNPKVLNSLKPSKEQLEKVYGEIMKEVNDLQLQIDSKKTLSCIDCQGKHFNTSIAKVLAKNVFFCLLMILGGNLNLVKI
jgi:hypothetical protein